MITAALRGVSEDLYEAASVDGANAFQRFFHITVPSVRSVLFLTVLLRCIWNFNFPDLIYSMTQGGPAGSSHIVTSYMMQLVQSLDYGLASAVGVLSILFLIVFAYFGTFGYELDLNTLSEEEQLIVKEQIRFMKKYRHLIQNGIFYRLKSPFEGTDAAWMVVSPDQKTALAAYFRMVQPVNAGYSRIRLQGLHLQYLYRISDREYSCYGDELMNAGLILSDYANGVRSSKVPQGDGQARIFLLTAEDGI